MNAPLVNLHVEKVGEVMDAIRRVRVMTGEEPVVCIHIYAASVEQLQELFPKNHLSSFKPSGSGVSGEVIFDGYFPPKTTEPPDLLEAREKLLAWSRHSTAYAIEQRAFWQRRVDLLSAAHEGAAAPPDHTEDES